jgi:hypothetical protein
MAGESFTVGERVKLRVERFAREPGTQGMVQFVFEGAPAYLITFDGETRETLVLANLLERSDDAAIENQERPRPSMAGA